MINQKLYLCSVLSNIFDLRFKSFKRFLIYIFHKDNRINLRKIAVNEITDDELLDISDSIFNEKIKKGILYELTDLSKNTFNKNFSKYFEKNDLLKRRTFTIKETYYILKSWQGEDKWGKLEAINKKTFAGTFWKGDYKKVADEMIKFLGDDNYLSNDKLSPKVVKEFIKHIGIDLSEPEDPEDPENPEIKTQKINLKKLKNILEFELIGFAIFTVLVLAIMAKYNS